MIYSKYFLKQKEEPKFFMLQPSKADNTGRIVFQFMKLSDKTKTMLNNTKFNRYSGNYPVFIIK